MKKDVAVVFGITNNYVFALANVLIGMKKHCKPFWDDILVYCDEISEDEMKALNKIIKCNFIKFDENTISGVVSEERLRTYSLLTLARFECFNLLNTYKKVIWHDVDILIQKDFDTMLSYGEKSGFALTCDPAFMVEQNFLGFMEGYNLLTPLYNAGVMVLSDKLMQYEKMSSYCYDIFNKYSEKLRYMDQSVLNMLIQDYNIDVEQIDLLKYCCHPSRDYKNATIVHAYGSEKFWNSDKLKKQFPEWNENNNEWLSIVGNEGTSLLSVRPSPTVSVVMSVYERIDFLDDSIKSILNQTFSSFELIIVVEKSVEQENIRVFLEKYDDDRIVIICNKEKLGFASSLNVGIEAAKGMYIARMDDDDISLPERFERQVNFLNQNPDISVVGTHMKMFMLSEQVCTQPENFEELRIKALCETPLYHPTVMLRKKAFDEHNYRYDPNYFTEDYELWTRILEKLKVANIHEILLHYRASGQNATASQQTKVMNSHLSIMRRNFNNNLRLDFTNDECLLLRHGHIVNACYNSAVFAEIRESCIKKIILANNELQVYDAEILKNYFGATHIDFSIQAKAKLQKHPILYRLAKKVYKIKDVFNKKGEKNGMSVFKKVKMALMPPSSRSFHSFTESFVRNGERHFQKLDHVQAILEKAHLDLLDLKGEQVKHIIGELKNDVRVQESKLVYLINEFKPQANELINMINELKKDSKAQESQIMDLINEVKNDARVQESKLVCLINELKNDSKTQENQIIDLINEVKNNYRLHESQKEITSLINQLILNTAKNNATLIANQKDDNLLKPNKKVLFLNDTYNDFHHGSCCTSYVIWENIKKVTTSYDHITIVENRQSEYKPEKLWQFEDENYYNEWIQKNKLLFNKLNEADIVIVNGEGCISLYNPDTCQLLYMIYIAKAKLNKHVELINTSVYITNYLDDSPTEYHNILKLVLNRLDYFAVRDYKSLIDVNNITDKSVVLSFDSTPLYIENHFESKKIIDGDYILLSGGNFINEKFYPFINEVLSSLPERLKNLRCYFLYSDVNTARCQDDIEHFNKLKDYVKGHNIELLTVYSINEWLSAIDNAKLIISGRYHHSIAAFMLDTPFLTFKTNTKKVEAILEMFNRKDNLLKNYDTQYALKMLNTDSFYAKNDSYTKDSIINLARNNFHFLKECEGNS